MLSRITSGKIRKPHLILIHGISGVGKSTFAADAPNTIWLASEDGTNNLDVSRFPEPKSWADVETAFNELAREKHNYKTLVIDSLDWLEPLLHQEICNRHGVKSIELAAGGYGKGWVEAQNEWNKLIKQISILREKMNIIFIAHNEIVKFSDPATQSEYDKFQIKLHKKAAAKFKEYVDTILFANFEVFTKKEGQKTKAFSDGVRVMYTESRPWAEAKNRFGLPYQLPLSWEEYEKAVEKALESNTNYDETKAKISEMVEQIKDEELKNAVISAVEKAGDNSEQLEKIRNRLAVRLQE